MVSRRLLWALVAASAFFASASIAHAAYPGLNGKIAFSHDPGNPGTSRDIYLFEADGSGEIAITGLPDDEATPAWSPDGTKIAFVRNSDIHVMNADGTGAVNVTNLPFGSNASPAWSPDGSRLAFSSTRSGMFGQNIYTMNADGSDVTRITTGTPDSEPAWSPDGQRIAFVRNGRVNTVAADGSDFIEVTSGGGRQPNWSPSGHRIAYAKSGSTPATTGIHTIDPDGSNDVDLTAGLNEANAPAWSPDSTKIVALRNSDVWTMNANGTSAVQLTTNIGNNEGPDWQPLPYPGYPRPKGATPLRVPLVPALATCSAPNRMHGPPLAFGSCSPPAQASPNLTVGTPDANGAAANSSGSVQYAVLLGVPGPPDDSDVRVTAALSDVRCSAAGAACGPANAIGGDDYAGELLLNTSVRVTDAWNGVSAGGGSDRATMIDIPFPLPVGCGATSSTSTGGSCSLDTSMNAVVPATVKDGDRTVAQLGAVQVLDGGPDGDTATADNSVFAVQGLFVP